MKEKNDKDFLAGISHDLKSPIASIIGYAELIASDEQADGKVKESAQRIIKSANSMLGIVKTILDENENEGAYSLYDMLFELRGETAQKIRGKDIELCVNCEKSVPEYFAGDGVSVRRIISNLLSNAAKYTEKGRISLDISYEGETLVIRVADTGRGIKSEDIQKVFEKYTRLDGTQSIEGTGIGLCVAKELAESLGGGIELVSTYGSGSSFTARIVQKKV